jgi:hypothetical protein
VKDFQQTITIKAVCRFAQMDISTPCLTWSATAVRKSDSADWKDVEIDFAKEEKSKQILIRNDFNIDLEYPLISAEIFTYFT